MPEGPSIVILKEELAPFQGRKVQSASGYAPIPMRQLKNKTVQFKTWGKHLLICFPKFTIKVHMMLFGSYAINERSKAKPVLHIEFAKGEFNFYASKVSLIEAPLDEVYDWSGDVMNKAWSNKNAVAKLKEVPDIIVCDAILDQDIFAGAGNIFKNEVLFRIRVHPASKVGKLPARKRLQLVKETVKYAFDFLKWKKAGVLKANWEVHTKDECPRCKIPLHKKHMGKGKRRTFYCENCQIKYT